jgi:hypothetical protein
MLDSGCSVKTFYSRGGKVAERIETDDSGERKRLRIAEIFSLHIQGEGKAFFFRLQVSTKKPLAGALQKPNYIFAEFGSLRAFG